MEKLKVMKSKRNYLEQGTPVPGPQTGTGSGPVGNKATQVAGECTKLHLCMYGTRLGTKNHTLLPAAAHCHRCQFTEPERLRITDLELM